VPHVNGSIEADDYKTPTPDEVQKAVDELGNRFDKRDIALYLASAGLLMGDGWRDAMWPAVDKLASSS
jgi:hypothetical protein